MTITLAVPLTRSGKIIAHLMAEHGDNLDVECIIRNLRTELDQPPFEGKTDYVLQVLDHGSVVWEHMPSSSLSDAKAYLQREQSANTNPDRTYRLISVTTKILPN